MISSRLPGHTSQEVTYSSFDFSQTRMPLISDVNNFLHMTITPHKLQHQYGQVVPCRLVRRQFVVEDDIPDPTQQGFNGSHRSVALTTRVTRNDDAGSLDCDGLGMQPPVIRMKHYAYGKCSLLILLRRNGLRRCTASP